MKKLIWILLFLFSGIASAAFPVLEYSVPFNLNGFTYTDYALFKIEDNGYIDYGVVYYANHQSAYNTTECNKDLTCEQSICHGAFQYASLPDSRGTSGYLLQYIDLCGYIPHFSRRHDKNTGEWSNSGFENMSENLRVDHTIPLSQSTMTTFPLVLDGYHPTNDDFLGDYGLGVVTFGTVVLEPNAGNNNVNQLTVVIEPIGMLPGSVVSIPSGVIGCNTNPEIACSAPISQVDGLQANPNIDNHWVFGHWEEIESPHSLTPSGSKTITARFFRTFRNAVTDTAGFRKGNGNTTGGECLDYVEYETDLPDNPQNDICTYSAVNCLGQASMKGYATGNTPRLGAIVIYIQGNGAMKNGHAGIVESINEGDGTMVVHDSNWRCSDPVNHPENCGLVENHTVEIGNAGIMGYIYATP